ncbi:MAG: hypothetical protein ACRC5C_04830, partial [Bacilli bacterium]
GKSGTNFEGVHTTGNYVVVHFSYEQTIRYLANETTLPLYAVQAKKRDTVYIAVPNDIDGQHFSNLLKSKARTVIPYVEDVFIRQWNTKTILTDVAIFFNIE